MDSTMTLLKDNELLKETATRLIKALGVDMAIFICRSNYWHGVLQLILDQEANLIAAVEDDQALEFEEPLQLHNLPQKSIQPYRQYADVQEIAIAA